MTPSLPTPRASPPRRRGSASGFRGGPTACWFLSCCSSWTQALFHFRDAIAAHWPRGQARADPAVRARRLHGSKPLRDIAELSIEASDLQADPAHKGLLILIGDDPQPGAPTRSATRIWSSR